jgi:hypothetical protein
VNSPKKVTIARNWVRKYRGLLTAVPAIAPTIEFLLRIAPLSAPAVASVVAGSFSLRKQVCICVHANNGAAIKKRIVPIHATSEFVHFDITTPIPLFSSVTFPLITSSPLNWVNKKVEFAARVSTTGRTHVVELEKI